ncbi:hypothetical protein, partial [Caballeronia glathei]|uniref:hypothetical protein n=1 Tax=Caballeronia glathei TaxID=60547 RepID=UPI0019D40A78
KMPSPGAYAIPFWAIPESKYTAPSQRFDDASPGGDSDVLKFRYLLPISMNGEKKSRILTSRRITGTIL